MFKEVLVPIDLGQRSSWERSIPFAIEIVRHFSARLHIMTVVPDDGFHYVSHFFPEHYEHAMLEQADKALHAFVAEQVPTEMTVQCIVAHGSIYREIVNTADQIGADAIIMASHTPDLSDILIGPNAERVLHRFKRSVLIIRN